MLRLSYGVNEVLENDTLDNLCLKSFPDTQWPSWGLNEENKGKWDLGFWDSAQQDHADQCKNPKTTDLITWIS